jgi:hypothetical protein
MALLSETPWHENPRPIRAYAWTSSAPAVVSPYYLDGRTVPAYWHGIGEDIYEAVGNAVTQDVDTKLPEGSILVTGTVKAGDFFSVNWITFGALGNQNRGASGTFLRDYDANQAAVAIGRFISGNVDTYGSAVENTVILTPTAGQTEIQVGASTFTPLP